MKLSQAINHVGKIQVKMMNQVSEKIVDRNKLTALLEELAPLHEKLSVAYNRLEFDLEPSEFQQLCVLTGFLYVTRDLKYSQSLLQGAKML